MLKRFKLVTVVSLIVLMLVGFTAFSLANNYPAREVRVIIPWSVGGMTDVMTRPIASWLQEYFGVPFVVENKPGGGGVVGSLAIENSRANGYIIGTTSMSTVTAKYFSPTYPDMNKVDVIAQIITIPATLTVSANSPWKTLEEYVAYAKVNPGKIKTSHSGFGASAHLYTAVFENLADIKTNQIPYSAYAEAVTALIGGHVDATHIPLPDVAPQVKAGKLRLLAIASEERHPDFPEVPTFKELGIDFVIGNYTGFVIPKGVPAEYRKVLEEAIEQCMQDPKIVKFLLNAGFQPLYRNAEGFAKTIKVTEDQINYLVNDLGVALIDD